MDIDKIIRGKGVLKGMFRCRKKLGKFSVRERWEEWFVCEIK